MSCWKDVHLDRQTDTKMFGKTGVWTDRRSEGHFGLSKKKSCHTKKNFIYAPIWLPTILLGPQ